MVGRKDSQQSNTLDEWKKKGPSAAVARKVHVHQFLVTTSSIGLGQPRSIATRLSGWDLELYYSAEPDVSGKDRTDAKRRVEPIRRTGWFGG